ncbi:MAG: DUF1513 domain-containing protein [Pseudomonadota bacterium]
MQCTRRQFLATLACTAVATTLPGCATPLALSARSTRTRYLSARSSSDGRYFLSGFDEAGACRFDIPLPERGHAVALHPEHHHVAVVARRPGQFLLVADLESGAVLHRLHSEAQRHFFGHGVYSPDGRWFYTTENDIESGNGLVVVRDVHNDYRVAREFSSHGIGPHELAWLSDGLTLAIANGGIDTRPETGRTMLNLDHMAPSLVYVDAGSGKLLEQHTLDAALHQNSIRHFAVANNDLLCFAMQYQGDPNDLPPLIGLHRRGGAIRLLQAPDAVHRQMVNYCGSVCVDSSGQWFAVSSPKGNVVTFWSGKDGEYAGKAEIPDGCGIAAGNQPGEFILSSGLGGLYRHQVADGRTRSFDHSDRDTRWDNHMTRLAL